MFVHIDPAMIACPKDYTHHFTAGKFFGINSVVLVGWRTDTHAIFQLSSNYYCGHGFNCAAFRCLDLYGRLLRRQSTHKWYGASDFYWGDLYQLLSCNFWLCKFMESKSE